MENINHSTQSQIDSIRHKALHNALVNGIKNDSVLTEIANRAEEDYTDKIGEESESRFIEYSKNIKFVKSVSDTHPLEDHLLSIDKWITFDKSLSLPDLPVQIKSSYRGVFVFKNGDSKNFIKPNWVYKHLSGLMVVVNCGPLVKPKEFRLQLLKEATRIRELIDTNHIPADRFIKDSNSSKIR